MSSLSDKLEAAGHVVIQQQDRLADAENAMAREHELTVLQAIKYYRKAIMWSVIMSTALVMEGYDTKLISSFFAQPAFQEKYGELQPDGSRLISAAWQSGIGNGQGVGCMIGLAIGGYVCDILGFRRTMMIALFVLPCLIFMQFFSPSLEVLLAAQILIGLPLGMFQAVTTVYAVDVMPTRLRGHLTSYVNMCWVIGQLIASGVLSGALSLPGSLAYRIPFAIQWVWPIPLFIGIYLAPESPWWLVRKDRLEEAKVVVRGLTSPEYKDFDVDKSISLMMFTVEHERQVNASTTYLGCFEGINLRRTLIAMAAHSMQVFSGSALRTNSTYFFVQAGLSTSMSFNMSIVTYAMGFVGVIISWFLMPRIGRRALFIWGLVVMAALFFVVGGLGAAQARSSASAIPWSIGALLVVSMMVFDITVGPVSYSLASEIPSSLLRNKTLTLARFTYSAINIAAGIIVTYQLNPSAWAWGAKAGFFWGGSASLGLLVTYFCIPEPKDRVPAELDILFEKKVAAAKFSSTKVDLSEAV